MNHTETLQVLAVLRGAYPAFYRGMSRDEAERVVALWTAMFSEDDAALVGAAVKALIATDERGFPPHIGAVKAKMRQIAAPAGMTSGEAWNLVAKAIRNSAYDSQKEFDRLPENIQRLVGSPSQLRDWAMMDSDTVQSVVASNFQRSFAAREKSDADYRALPGDVKALISGMAERMMLSD